MIKAIAICGPTASGKTALSLRLSRDLPIEIISADSMQIYRGMDIGTAKATPADRAAVRHHMIDVTTPDDNYSSGRYRAEALAAALDITSRGKIPVFVGGTGLYIDTLRRDVSCDVPPSDQEYHDRLMSGADSEEYRIALWKRLYEVDPESAEAVHYNNVRRVVRALEIYDTTGRKKSDIDKESNTAAKDIDMTVICLDIHDRENLYRRVDARAESMFKDGLYDEVRTLYESGVLKEGSTASGGIGYKEVISVLKGETTLAEAKELVKLSSRRYAKRQLTWFHHIADRVTVYLDTEDGLMRPMEDVYREIYGTVNFWIRKTK